MTDKYGFFAEHEYISPIASQAVSRIAKEGVKANYVRPFRPVSGARSGTGNDATFSTFHNVISGNELQRKGAGPRSKAEHGVVTAERVKPFKPASPSKRATAPQAGELFGTISGRYPYILDGGQRRPKKGQVAAQPKNFVTRRSPQGGPGIPGLTLSQLKHRAGVAGEYAYHADPCVVSHHGTAAKTGEGVASKQLFKAACHSRFAGTFDRMQYEALGTTLRKQATSALRPFKPGFSGRTRAFSPQPAYMACPATPSAKPLDAKGLTTKHSWRPSHASVTSATRSIVVMNLK